MSELSQRLADAKAALAPVKAQGIDSVSEEKAQAFSKPPETYLQQRLNAERDSTEERLSKRIPDPREIVARENNVIRRRDGSISVVLANGDVIDDVDPSQVPEFLARQQAIFSDTQAGVSNTPLVDKTYGLAQEGIELLKDIGVSTYEFGKNIVDTSKGDYGTTAQTLTSAVEEFNTAVRANKYGGNTGLDPNTSLITTSDINTFNKILDSLDKDTPLTADQENFIKNDRFKNLATLRSRVGAHKKDIDIVEEKADFFKSYLPTSQERDVGASLAFKRIAENEGTLAAIKNTIANDLDVLAWQGYKSIPYMLAFTAGGPLTQTAVLASLAKAKSREMTSIFMEENDGRDPTVSEQSRIDAFSAVSTLAEKFGDMAALGVISKSKLPRIFNTKKIIESLLPESVKKILRTPVARGTLAATGLSTKVGQRVAKGLTGEAASGAITSVADQIALTGGIDDPSQIAFDALAEAVGTVGGLGGMVAGRTAKQLLKTTRDAINAIGTSAATGRGAEGADAPTEAPIDDTGPIQDTEPVNTEPIEVSKFDKALDDIKELVDDATPEGIKDIFFKLSRLGKRELTETQAAAHKIALDAQIKKLKDLSEYRPSDITLGSLGPIDELTPEDLQELSVNQDATEADKIFIDNIIEAQELADEIASDVKNTQQLETAGKPTVVESFNSLLNEIRGVSSDATFGTAETKAARTSSLISQLGAQLTNTQNKLSAVVAAGRFTPKAGQTAAIRSTRINPEDPNDLTVEFSEPISLSEAQIIEEESQPGTTIIRVDPSSTDQVDQLNKEVEFGNLIVDLANTHADTSFAQQGQIQRLAADAAKQLEAQKPPTISTEKVDAEIESIKDPTETEKPAPKKEVVKKTTAQEFTDPTVSTDPVVINRKVWENKEVVVTNEDGTTETVRAGDLWDSLHADLEMADNLLRCVK